MALREQLEEDIKQAMRDRERVRVEALRFLKSAVQAVEKTKGESLDDPALIEVVTRQANDRRESIRMFEQGNRHDLVAKEAAELTILEEYLPPQLSREELTELVKATISEVGATSARDKGRVMGRLMPQVRGKADGGVVNSMVTELLESAS